MKKNYAFLFLVSLLIFASLACNLSFRDGNIAMTITLKRDNIITLINNAQGIAGSVSDSELPIAKTGRAPEVVHFLDRFRSCG